MENTIIMFMSDNGAEGHDIDQTWDAELFPAIRKVIDDTHDFSYDNMGKPNSYVFYGPDWARTSAPAHRLYKGFPTEGGTRVPAFIYYPKEFPSGRIERDLFYVKDVTPTLLDFLGVIHPSQSDQPHLERPTGLSQVQNLKDPAFVSPERTIAFELMGKISVRRGHWKLIKLPVPYGTDDWQLFNLEKDPAEKENVIDQYPDIKADLITAWQHYAKQNNVILPNWVSGY